MIFAKGMGALYCIAAIIFAMTNDGHDRATAALAIGVGAVGILLTSLGFIGDEIVKAIRSK